MTHLQRPRTGEGRVRRFRASQSGATAVEFGLIAFPFFFLMFAIIETGMIFWSTQVLETAVANASRQIYTGQFQQDKTNTGLTAVQLRAKFKDAVCSNVTALFDCPGRVDVDVRSFSNYSSTTVSRPVSNGSYDASGYGYTAPSPNQITVVRASMEYPVFVNMLAPFTGLTNGNRLIMASTTFRTEPY